MSPVVTASSGSQYGPEATALNCLLEVLLLIALLVVVLVVIPHHKTILPHFVTKCKKEPYCKTLKDLC